MSDVEPAAHEATAGELSAAQAWSQALASWAIPQSILDAAPEPPWGYSMTMFARRADAAMAVLTPSNLCALEALPEAGSVLDVGCGAGAASLPLAARGASHLTGVDASAEMLAAFSDRVAASGAGVTAIEGAWPDVAAQTPLSDVVVCHHVAYNVPDLAAFARALTAHARRRVVMELTALHPMSRLNGLWRRFYGLDRPSRPTGDDALAVLRELGLAPEHEEWMVPEHGSFMQLDEMVAATRRMLCLPSARDAELAAAMAAEGLIVTHPDGSVGFPARSVVTVWWAGAAD